ncbi:MAG: hypothetical protein ACXABY_17660 [Candidatus Thorarchaeota archaeon]|jgi:hypothetical protein
MKSKKQKREEAEARQAAYVPDPNKLGGLRQQIKAGLIDPGRMLMSYSNPRFLRWAETTGKARYDAARKEMPEVPCLR